MMRLLECEVDEEVRIGLLMGSFRRSEQAVYDLLCCCCRLRPYCMIRKVGSSKAAHGQRRCVL